MTARRICILTKQTIQSCPASQPPQAGYEKRSSPIMLTNNKNDSDIREIQWSASVSSEPKRRRDETNYSRSSSPTESSQAEYLKRFSIITLTNNENDNYIQAGDPIVGFGIFRVEALRPVRRRGLSAVRVAAGRHSSAPHVVLFPRVVCV